MNYSDMNLGTLRDRISSATLAIKKAAQMIEIRILLDELKLGLISKDDVLNNSTYIEFRKEQNKKTQKSVKSLGKTTRLV